MNFKSHFQLKMSSTNEILSKYREYIDINYRKSKLDDEDDPYKSKYEARTFLTDLKNNLDPQITTENDIIKPFFNEIEESIQKTYFKSSQSYLIDKLLDYNLAKNYIETDETGLGERLLTETLKQLDIFIIKSNDPTQSISIYNPIIYHLYLSILNELVFVWSHRQGEYDTCLKLLTKSHEVFEFYKQNTATIHQPFLPIELIQIDSTVTDSDRELAFEMAHTKSLYYFAQLYGKMGDRHKSAFYCQKTLQRQLNYKNNTDLEDNTDKPLRGFNKLEWATHAAALSQYYVSENDFPTARHCLLCVDSIINYVLKEKDSLKEDEKNKFDEQIASNKRCWIKYALQLLKTSKECLLAVTDSDHKLLLKDFDKPPQFRFQIDIDSASINTLSSNIALDYSQAKEIFLKTQTILDDVLNVYKLDGYVSDHCEILRDKSELYKLLAFFDESTDNKCKMFKRRLDLLKPVADDLSEQYYLTLKRQFLFEIAEILSDMMDMKFELLQTGEKKSDGALVKINQLATQSISYFNKFLDTMKVLPKKERLPEKFDAHLTRPILLAHFYLGRLYSKLIPKTNADKLANVKKTYEYYEFIVKYCDKYIDDKELKILDLMGPEYNVCKEALVFLPVKLENIRKTCI